MNEFLLLLHILIIFGFTQLSLRLGKAALGSWLCIQVLLANLFVMKQVVLFGLDVTCSDVFAIGSLLSLNLLQECYGPSESRKVTTHCFYFMLFFAILSQIHLLYIPSREDVTQSAYKTLLSPAPRLLFASLLTFYLVQQIDIRLFTRLKARLPGAPFSVRAFVSLLLSQMLDTALFSFIGLYGLVHSVLDLMILSFAIKAGVIATLVPLTHLCKKWVKPQEIHL